jgi:tyrosine-protein kinase
VADRTELQPRTFRDYVRAVRGRLWLVGVIVAISSVTAFFLSNSQTRMYTATARMMYVQPADVSDPTDTSSSVNVDTLVLRLQSAAQEIEDPAVRQRVASLLSSVDAHEQYDVTATVVAPEGTSNASAFADSVLITVESPSATASAKIANAYAEAIIALRKEAQQARYRAAQKVVQNQLDLFTNAESKLSADYVNLLQQLRNLQIAEATAMGDFQVVVPAQPPDSPSSPKPLQAAALGFGAGLLLGIALAYLMGRFDTRVRTHREIADALGLAVVGRVPRIGRRTAHDDGLVALTAPDGHVSEALRILRTNLDWAGIDDHLTSLLFTSCVKGEGKTLTLCNLAVTLARAGKRVIVVDADLRDPRVHKVLGLRNSIGLTSVALGAVALADALQTFDAPARSLARVSTASAAGRRGEAEPLDDWARNLSILTSGPVPPDPGEMAASKRLAGTIRELAALEPDYLLVDAPPLLGFGDAAALSASVDGLLLVVNVEAARRHTLADVHDQLEALPCRKVGAIVVGERLEHEQYYGYKQPIAET